MTLDEQLLVAIRLMNREDAIAAITAGADVNSRTDTGQTPLHFATDADAFFVQLLIDNGADINAMTEMGATPLHWASYEGDVGIVSLLIVSGADINAKDERGCTPLQWAVDNGRDDVSIRLMQAAKTACHTDRVAALNANHVAAAVRTCKKDNILPDH